MKIVLAIVAAIIIPGGFLVLAVGFATRRFAPGRRGAPVAA